MTPFGFAKMTPPYLTIQRPRGQEKIMKNHGNGRIELTIRHGFWLARRVTDWGMRLRGYGRGQTVPADGYISCDKKLSAVFIVRSVLLLHQGLQLHLDCLRSDPLPRQYSFPRNFVNMGLCLARLHFHRFEIVEVVRRLGAWYN